MFHDLRSALGVVFLVWAMASPAWADPGGSLNWTFQDTTITTSGAGQTALAMRNGMAWPVIFSDTTPYAAYTLFPAGGKSGGASWQPFGPSGLFKTGYRLRTASSPDGRVACVSNDSPGGQIMPLSGSVTIPSGGWISLPANTKAVAFDRNGALYTATYNSVSAGPKFTGTNIVDVAVSPAGDIGVIDSSRKYWQYSPWVGSWLSTTVPFPQPNPPVTLRPESMDLTFDSLSRPHVVGGSSTGIYAFDFSIISGSWTTTMLGTTGNSSTYLALAANNKAQVATAWVDTTGSLVYAYKEDNAAWSSTIVSGSAYAGQKQVGIAYDYADLPVLSYVGASPKTIMLAYDPVAAPEPGSLGVFALAAVLSLRRRRT
jgi:hypothetical protein